jgi:tetratricopeptide (TPR) repeat protein
MKTMTILLMTFLGLGTITAQDLENELGFIYVKADYLLETNRFEDAIAEFTRIIDKDPAFKDALFKRANCKFSIAAFKGAKKDLLQSFEVTGISPESLLLFGKTQKNLDEHDAASKTLNTASMLREDDSRSRRPGKRVKDEENDSTDDGTVEDKSTEDKIKEKAKNVDESISDILDQILDRTQKSDDGDKTTDEGSNEAEAEVVKNKVDNSVNEIYIDDDLTILIKDGIGSRKILSQPNILILSEDSGNVAVDVCIDRNGKVTSAEYNKDNSTLKIESLVSLAVRKSQEFWFKGSDKAQECGSIIFKISGRK